MFLALRALCRTKSYSNTIIQQHICWNSSLAPKTPGPPKRNRKPISVALFIRDVRKVFNNAKKMGLNVRPDGYVNVAEMKKREHLIEMPMKTFLSWLARTHLTFNLVEEPELHSAGKGRNRLIWWVRETKRRVPKGMDQADYRIKPGTSVRNAIYKATLAEWENIRKNGIRPPLGKNLVTMSAIDKIDETTDAENTSCVYVFVDMEAAIRGGVEFYFTRYYNVLSPGDKNGVILPKFFKDAIEVTIEKQQLLPRG